MTTKRYMFEMMVVVLSLAFALPKIVLAQTARPVIVISPGHGWLLNGKIDPGAVNSDLVEKDLTLDIAKQTREFLARCPLDVQLTCEADDPNHALADVAGIVNGHNPDVAISIHINSAPNASGTEAWHTVGGHDDDGSKQLSRLLADEVASWFNLENRGIKPETDNRHKRLYIHDWKVPASLTELAFIQGDEALLRTRKRDFARAVAVALLNYLALPTTCADSAVSKTIAVAAYFPGQTLTNHVSLQNDGLNPWTTSGYVLANVRDI